MSKRTKKQTKKLISNIVMIAVIAVVICAGLLFTAHQKGLLRDTQKTANEYAVSIKNIRGEISIVRNGISFFAKKDDILMKNDVINSLNLSSCEINFDGNSIYLNQNTKLSLDNIERGAFSANVLEGDISANINLDEKINIHANGKLVNIGNNYFSLNANGMYSDSFSTTEEENGKDDKSNKDDKPNKKNDKENDNKPDKGEGSGNKPANKPADKSDKKPDKPDVKPTGKPTEKPKPNPSPKPGNICTIAIRCDDINDNLDDLVEGKDKYVPLDGYILKKIEVTFEEGQTAFDVLKKVCDEKNIPLEYSFTPGLETYYVEGINHLYEFDCGDTSGWLYEVNGKRPIRGSSEYIVQSGDHFDWQFSCSLGL